MTNKGFARNCGLPVQFSRLCDPGCVSCKAEPIPDHIPLDIILDARQDRIPQQPGPSRAARAVRKKSICTDWGRVFLPKKEKP